MSPFQISTCTPARHPTFLAKTRRSHALSGLPLARTTSAQTSQKIIGSMVGMLAGVCCAPKKLLSALRDGYWHSRSWKEPTHSFRWSFYMNAIAENRGIHSMSQSSWFQSCCCITAHAGTHTCARTCTHKECLPRLYTSRVSGVLQPLTACHVSTVVTGI